MLDRRKACSIDALLRPFPFVMAPLAGITDSSFRTLCFEQGAGLAYTEMVSVKGLHYNNKNTASLLALQPEEGPVGVQLFGSDPTLFAEAACALRDHAGVLLDINMGCPVPKVVKNGEGAALLEQPALAASCVRAAVDSASVPVTVKMRIGFESDTYDYVSFAQAMEAAGCSAIVVHGRTRRQYYSGYANWKAIAEICEQVRIPVIGNGDVFDAESGLRRLEESGCDGVMIARGALGNPWLFRDIRALWAGEALPPGPSWDEVHRMILHHIDLAMRTRREAVAVREMRKHIGWYVKGFPRATHLRDAINRATTISELVHRLEEHGASFPCGTEGKRTFKRG